jgi:hypothetical protein
VTSTLGSTHVAVVADDDAWNGVADQTSPSIDRHRRTYALTDSPVGWLAWMIGKFRMLTDNSGDFLTAVNRDTFLTDVTLYWVTGTVGSAMRIYRENRLTGEEMNVSAGPRRSGFLLCHPPSSPLDNSCSFRGKSHSGKADRC